MARRKRSLKSISKVETKAYKLIYNKGYRTGKKTGYAKAMEEMNHKPTAAPKKKATSQQKPEAASIWDSLFGSPNPFK
tara:strand:+ start:3583 stop:3816 length:234 start_codon:yes stop_codon:yes gene_type:complete